MGISNMQNAISHNPHALYTIIPAMKRERGAVTGAIRRADGDAGDESCTPGCLCRTQNLHKKTIQAPYIQFRAPARQASTRRDEVPSWAAHVQLTERESKVMGKNSSGSSRVFLGGPRSMF